MHRRLVASLAVALMLTACGTSHTTSPSGHGVAPTATTAPHVVSTALGTGVTASTIKVGISLVDFDCIKQFVDSIRINQQQVYQAYIDDINAKGGINGRKIVPTSRPTARCERGRAQRLVVHGVHRRRQGVRGHRQLTSTLLTTAPRRRASRSSTRPC